MPAFDTFQGSMNTVSPAMGPYTILTYVNIDQSSKGLTGAFISGYTGNASGVTGANTLEPWKYSQGVTGISAANFKNDKTVYF